MQELPPNVTREGGGDDASRLASGSVVSQPLHVDLPDQCAWSNDAADLALTTYFDAAKPNLGVDFGLAGLQPVIRDTGSDVFLLRDGGDKFYVWSARVGDMSRIDDKTVTGAQAAVMAIMRDSGTLQTVPVWRKVAAI